MNERVIVSQELESIIDKDNVFGNEPSGEIPVTILLENCSIRSTIISLYRDSDILKVEFMTTPILAQEILVCKEIMGVTVGLEEFEIIDSSVYAINSITVSAHEDMYLCSIIIKTSK
jgi:hypothetical protein